MTTGLETFAKVRALHDRATSAGEREAAAGRMAQLARKAGMTVAEAVSKLDAPPPPPAQGGGFADFFNTPIFREGLARHERERAARWREVLEEYGTEEAVFYPGPWEQALDDAHSRFGPHPGWDAYPLDKVPPEIVATVEAAYPMPTTTREAWVELAFWDQLGRDREARGSGCGDSSPPVEIRRRLLERLLDTMPAHSLDDMRARMDWLDYLNHVETAPDPKDERVRLATLRADIERMGVQFGRAGTSAENAADLSGENLSDAQVLTSPDLGSSNALDEGMVISPIPSHAADAMDLSSPDLASSDFPPDPGKTPPVQSGQAEGSVSNTHPLRRTNADKRRDVLALLQAANLPLGREAAPLTDREIARRAGVSPSTVGSIRKGMGGTGG